jgi:hypothetical protein
MEIKRSTIGEELEEIWSIIKENSDEKKRNGVNDCRQYAKGWHYDLYETRQDDCPVFELYGEAQ